MRWLVLVYFTDKSIRRGTKVRLHVRYHVIERSSPRATKTTWKHKKKKHLDTHRSIALFFGNATYACSRLHHEVWCGLGFFYCYSLFLFWCWGLHPGPCALQASLYCWSASPALLKYSFDMKARFLPFSKDYLCSEVLKWEHKGHFFFCFFFSRFSFFLSFLLPFFPFYYYISLFLFLPPNPPAYPSPLSFKFMA